MLELTSSLTLVFCTAVILVLGMLRNFLHRRLVSSKMPLRPGSEGTLRVMTLADAPMSYSAAPAPIHVLGLTILSVSALSPHWRLSDL